MSRVMLCGATGLVGREVLRLALKSPEVTQLTAPTRRPLPAHPKLINPIVDFEQLPADAEGWQVEAAICTLGTTIRKAGTQAAFRRVDFDYVLACARLARAGGAQAFALVTSLGANAASRNFYLRTKGEVENAVRALGFPSLTLLRPSLIGGQREQRRVLERVSMCAMQALAPCIPRRYLVVPASCIAQALLHAALAQTPGCRVLDSAQLQPGGGDFG